MFSYYIYGCLWFLKLNVLILSSMFLVNFIPKFYVVKKRGRKRKEKKSERMYESIKLVKKREKEIAMAWIIWKLEKQGGLSLQSEMGWGTNFTHDKRRSSTNKEKPWIKLRQSSHDEMLVLAGIRIKMKKHNRYTRIAHMVLLLSYLHNGIW